jgi:hypothetical protein
MGKTRLDVVLCHGLIKKIGKRSQHAQRQLVILSAAVFIIAFFSSVLLPQLKPEAQENTQTLPVSRDEALVIQKLPVLSDLARPYVQVYEPFLDYATCILKPDWIKTEDNLLSIFPRKMELIKLLLDYCQEPFEKIASLYRKDPRWPALEKELSILGIKAFTAEDYWAGLSDGPFLEDLVSRVASEPCQLFIQMKYAQTESFGGEYPYMDLDDEMKMVEIGEMLLQSFPDSKFTIQMKDMLFDALVPLTDVHEVGDLYIVGGLSRRAYPGLTDITQHQRFIEDYPNSRFPDVVARIIGSISNISGEGPIYAVVTDACTSEKEARQVVLTYLLQGVDIPHILTDTGDAQRRYVAYRFYTDKEKASQALKEIQRIKPQALIRVF